MNITISTMLDSDIKAICALQSENLRDNLAPDQLGDGYLSIAFSEDEFSAFDRDLGVVVARDQNEVIGYCCLSSARFNAGFPILDQLVSRLPSYTLPKTSQRAAENNTCIYGPACIAGPYRGKGVLNQLFSHGLSLAKNAGFAFCFSFVGSENQRSLAAHLKLPFSKVGQIEYNGREFTVIACRLKA